MVPRKGEMHMQLQTTKLKVNDVCFGSTKRQDESGLQGTTNADAKLAFVPKFCSGQRADLLKK